MKRIIALLLPVLLLVGSLSAQTGIEDLAPDDSVFLLGVRNLEQSQERFLKSPLGELWRSDQVVKLRRELEEKLKEGLEEMASTLEVEPEDFVLPTGAAGLAVYGYRNEETGSPMLGILLTADYGEGADDMMKVLEAALEKAADEGEIEHESREILGRTIHTISIPEAPDEEEEEDEFGGMDGMDMIGGFLPDAGDIFGENPEFHIVRAGSVFLAGNDLGSLTAALEIIAGEPGAVASERDDFRSIMSRLDDDPDLWSIVLTANLPKLVSVFDPMGMSMMATPVIKAAVGEIDGLGMSMRLESPEAMMETTMFISMPQGPAGLTALFAGQTPIERVPSFAGPDTFGITRINFDFPALADTIREIVRTIPMLGPPQQEQAEEFIATMDRITSTLGSRVWVVQSMTRPLEQDSLQQLLAVECLKPEKFETALSEFAPQIGMEPRDFLGMRIYTADLGMMGMQFGLSEFALGIGGRHILLGGETAVEAGLRALHQGGPGGLDDESAFRRVSSSLPADPVAVWQFGLTVEALEAAMTRQQASRRAMIDQFREFDPEMAAEMEAEFKAENDPFGDLDFDLLRRYLGPNGGFWRVNETGFVMKAFVLEAQPEGE